MDLVDTILVMTSQYNLALFKAAEKMDVHSKGATLYKF